MNLSRVLPRRAAMVVLLAVFALGSTACSAFGPVGRSAAAEVDGTTIPVDDVFELLEASKRSDAMDPNGTGTVAGEGLQDTWAMSNFTQVLQALINRQVIDDELDRRGIKVTDENRDASRQQLAQSLASEGDAPDADPLDKIDPALVDWSVEAGAAQMALTEALDESDPEAREQELRDLYEEVKDDATQVCLSAVFVRTEADATSVKDRLEGGEDIAAIAAAESTETQTKQNGGQLGCGATAQAVEVVGPSLTADSQNGDVLDPFQTVAVEGQDWIVARVDSIQVPSFEELRPQLEQSSPDTAQEAVQEQLGRLFRRADVTVVSKYGTWDAENGQVLPPVGATAPTTEPSALPAASEPVPTDAG